MHAKIDVIFLTRDGKCDTFCLFCFFLQIWHNKKGLLLEKRGFCSVRVAFSLRSQLFSTPSSSMNSTCVKGKCPTFPRNSPSHCPLMDILVTVTMSPTSRRSAVRS